MTTDFSTATTTSQHTGCVEMNQDVVHSKRKDAAVLSAAALAGWHLCLGPPRGTLFIKVRKRRDILEHYSTTIKQLQGPQFRSYMLLLSHIPPLLSFTPLAPAMPLPQPHVLTHSPLWKLSHTSVLPLHTRQLGSSWNRTSQWNDSNDSHQWEFSVTNHL